VRGELLSKACQLADCTPSNLPDRIRKMVVEQSRVEDSKRLKEENARLNLEVGGLINENRAARVQAEAAAEKIRMFANQASEVVAKAEFFDEKVRIGSKPPGTRIALILTDYSEKLERILVDMREVVNQITDLRRQPERPDLGASSSKGVPNLSNLSLPETFSGLPSEELTGMGATPKSKVAPGPADS
jgi:predicted transcriptional regulator